MAKVHSNDKNFLIIEMSDVEASNLGFGISVPGSLNEIICGTCNEVIENGSIYYVAGVNEVFCKDCLDDFISNMNHYIDDDSLRYEINHFNIIAKKLGMSERANFTPDSKIIISSN